MSVYFSVLFYSKSYYVQKYNVKRRWLITSPDNNITVHCKNVTTQITCIYSKVYKFYKWMFPRVIWLIRFLNGLICRYVYPVSVLADRRRDGGWQTVPRRSANRRTTFRWFSFYVNWNICFWLSVVFKEELGGLAPQNHLKATHLAITGPTWF